MKRGRKPKAAPILEGGGSQALHMTFRLSPELRGQLITAAGERPIGDEIRRRLERSFLGSYEPRLDQRSLALLDGIVAAINALGSDRLVPMVNALAAARSRSTAVLDELGPWHSDPNAFAALREAIQTLLRLYRPEGEPDEIAHETLTSIALGAAARAVDTRDPKKHLLGQEEDHDGKARP